MSGEKTGDTYDLETILEGGQGTAGVPHGDLLLNFADAVLGDDDATLSESRTQLAAALGPEAVIDAVGVISSFNSVVRVADATGIPVESFKEEAAEKLKVEFNLGTPN